MVVAHVCKNISVGEISGEGRIKNQPSCGSINPGLSELATGDQVKQKLIHITCTENISQNQIKEILR